MIKAHAGDITTINKQLPATVSCYTGDFESTDTIPMYVLVELRTTGGTVLYSLEITG